MTHPDGMPDELVTICVRSLKLRALSPSKMKTTAIKLKQRGVTPTGSRTYDAALCAISALLDGTKTET